MNSGNFTCEAIATSEDLQWYAQTLAHCFLSTPAAESTYLNRVGREHCLLVRKGLQRVGGLLMLPMGQWFGGKRVSMTGIASVAIAPEARGQGAARALMERALHRMNEEGAALSVLYPASQDLYRKFGYEQGGAYCGWEIETQHIKISHASSETLPVRAVAIANPDCMALYRRQAGYISGHLDRHACLWQQRVAKAETEALYAYTFGESDRLEGYVLYRQEQTPEGNIVQILDRSLLTARALQCFWSFWRSYRSQVDRLRWYGGEIDDLAVILPEQKATSWMSERWLLRVIDVTRALSARGYPPQLQADLHLDVRDEWLDANSDRFHLHVSAGVATVRRGGTGALKLDIRGLASLYSGLFSARQLHSMGWLEGEADVVEIASQVFAGEPPWMPDFF